MSTENVDRVSPAQCRAARGLLGMTQPALASAAELGISTIVDFEESGQNVSVTARLNLWRTLEVGGIEFIDENGGGPGVRLRKRQRPK